MMNFKNALTVLAAVATIGTFAGIASADTIGVVDVDRIYTDYAKAQNVSADMKVKEADLQKFLADAQKKLKETTSPVERKNLEDKLTLEFKNKAEKYKSYQIDQIKEIEKNVFDAIDSVSKTDKIDIVVVKQSVLTGGKDITDEVLTTLNKK